MRWPLFLRLNHCAVSVVVNVFVIGGSMHTLYGDGIHDDGEAFQAYLRGEPVLRPDGTTWQSSGPEFPLPPKIFLGGKPLQGSVKSDG